MFFLSETSSNLIHWWCPVYQQLSFLKREPHWILQKNHWHVHEEDFFFLWKSIRIPIFRNFCNSQSNPSILVQFHWKKGHSFYWFIKMSFLKREPHWILQKDHWHVHEEEVLISFYKSLTAQILLVKAERVSILGNFCNSQLNHFFFIFFAKIGLKLSGCTSN